MIDNLLPQALATASFQPHPTAAVVRKGYYYSGPWQKGARAKMGDCHQFPLFLTPSKSVFHRKKIGRQSLFSLPCDFRREPLAVDQCQEDVEQHGDNGKGKSADPQKAGLPGEIGLRFAIRQCGSPFGKRLNCSRRVSQLGKGGFLVGGARTQQLRGGWSGSSSAIAATVTAGDATLGAVAGSLGPPSKPGVVGHAAGSPAGCSMPASACTGVG